LKGDVLDYITKTPAQPTHPPTVQVAAEQAQRPTAAPTATPVQGKFTDISLSNMRQVIAKRLSKSKTTIPHEYIRGEAWLDELMELRRDLKARAGLKLSVNDMLIKACALGLRMAPELNATCDEATNMVIIQPNVDISMAVATPAGLITPILFNADRTPITKLSARASVLAKKARDGKLQPHEFQGGTFTVSNLGMFKIREFTAIINQPQVAILAVGAGRPRALSSYAAETDGDEVVRFSNSLTFTLSIDSRFVEETAAGHFISRVSHLLSHPEMLLYDDPVAVAAMKTTKADQFDSMMLELSVRPPPPPPKAVRA
jgi:pyruvate dehydrogenase E2 component (dihydrolipoamide acetyltransferase)